MKIVKNTEHSFLREKASQKIARKIVSLMICVFVCTILLSGDDYLRFLYVLIIAVLLCTAILLIKPIRIIRKRKKAGSTAVFKDPNQPLKISELYRDTVETIYEIIWDCSRLMIVMFGIILLVFEIARVYVQDESIDLTVFNVSIESFSKINNAVLFGIYLFIALHTVCSFICLLNTIKQIQEDTKSSFQHTENYHRVCAKFISKEHSV